MLDFVAVGPPRTATTWIHEYLKRQQDVRLPKELKETHFFSWKYEKGIDWYFSHFASSGPHKITGEVCPTYFDSPRAAE